jgi:hypothetical protein
VTWHCDVLAPIARGKGRPSDGRVHREAEHLDEDWGGDLASELEQGGRAGRGWLDAALDELTADVLCDQMPAGDTAGKSQQSGGGRRRLARDGQVAPGRAVEGLGGLDREGVKLDGHVPVVVCGDLLDAHPSDPRQGLGEEQGEVRRLGCTSGSCRRAGAAGPRPDLGPQRSLGLVTK